VKLRETSKKEGKSKAAKYRRDKEIHRQKSDDEQEL
jgi:hypothetical protein